MYSRPKTTIHTVTSNKSERLFDGRFELVPSAKVIYSSVVALMQKSTFAPCKATSFPGMLVHFSNAKLHSLCTERKSMGEKEEGIGTGLSEDLSFPQHIMGGKF